MLQQKLEDDPVDTLLSEIQTDGFWEGEEGKKQAQAAKKENDEIEKALSYLDLRDE